MKTITIRTIKKEEIIDITDKVEEQIPKDFSGICNVFVRHATAAIIINENYDPNLCEDIINCLDKLIPQGIWKHDKIDKNGAAHIKAAILGPGENIPVEKGKLKLGRWQGIGLAELDGPREREIIINLSQKFK
ncbi:YjbQ family protein [Candidatus Woesearchaeota archaeon]|nr:MAG: hypothetical protein B6U93_01765 [Candidatus Woesearchaeota archaeon ex4484_78]RLE45924.1 MAG: YjbQ family protein [Candidatus Woesearchaeota archaeon]